MLQKIKLKGAQMGEAQSRYDALEIENRKLIDDLREAERIVCLEKERVFGLERSLVE